MDEQGVIDFKPRARGMIIGDIPWLARITDKVRARLQERIGDYIYPCAADQRWLREMELSPEEFTELVAGCRDDDEVIGKMKAHIAAKGDKG